jgi:hypothetical protein
MSKDLNNLFLLFIFFIVSYHKKVKSFFVFFYNFSKDAVINDLLIPIPSSSKVFSSYNISDEQKAVQGSFLIFAIKKEDYFLELY